MAAWATFAGITGVVLVLLLVFSRQTQSAFSDSNDDSLERPEPSATDASLGTDADLEAGEERVSSDTSPETRSERGGPRQSEEFDPESLSTAELLANVALSQGLFAIVLIGAVIYAGIPADALGIEFSRSFLERGLVVGTASGLALYVANEIGAAVSTRFGFDHDEDLRELLAPETLSGWLALLVIVLPIIAFFEELLFRAALIGALSAGFGISPWLLAVGSSVAFAAGHGMQGSVGVVITGLLGFVLAAIFVATGSLLAVVVAHYLINALEFAVHEGVGFEWAQTLES
ncbi:CPBP family intramembrane glutamic endopeptidase [Natronorubrum halophilum]|uniref:CPBP family intramembrane glutamic endopeptidase n=1 Tax=Natronorubrum halophilum TaxID=1702106 RepID=UPI0010C22E56|nr:CPBP family intramembrane glutamic endopeptidase [Natronorubrum halophilum]